MGHLCSPSRFSLTAVLIGAFVVACGSHASNDGRETSAPIEECDAFLTAYEHCLDSLGPANVARARVEQTRAGLAAQVGNGPAARSALRKQCADNLSQIKATCR
jgi:hypothetical protein